MRLKFLVFYMFFTSRCFAQQPGTVIFLNGCSSAGKSSITRELKLLNPSYEVVSIDDILIKTLRNFFKKYDAKATEEFFELVDSSILLSFDSFLSNKKREQYLVKNISPEKLQQARLAAKKISKIFKKHLIRALWVLWHGTKAELIEKTKTLALQGKTVILDHVAFDRKHLRKMVRELQGIPVVFIGVKAPIKVILERERRRGNRFSGTARSVFELVHAHDCYDETIDTSKITPYEGALRVQKLVKNAQSKEKVFSSAMELYLKKPSIKWKYGWLTFKSYFYMGSKILWRKLTPS